jgi:glycosyltransferase involved in cell wall biosynthesis
MKRQVVTIHDISPIDHPEWLSRKFALFYQLLTPCLARRVQRIITDSQFTKRRLIETTKVTPDKIVVIPCGVDPKFHPRPLDEVAAALSSLALPSARYLLTVGSLEPRKNLRRLIKAWALAQDRMPADLWLVVAGGKGNAAVFARETGVEVLAPRVHLTGHVADDVLPALYAGASGFCYMSLYEGFGLPPLEAMASGVPVLVSEGTAFPEVVGDCGLYADPLDVEKIAEQMVRLVTDSSASALLAARGLERAKQFTWDECARRTFEVLKSVASED